LAVYLDLLVTWNRKMNLVGPGDWRTILTTLVADSFHLAAFVKELPLPHDPLCLDPGAGAGLPGIPLRILWTQGRYHMVESRQKRALFLRHALMHCRLERTWVVQGRVESLSEELARADLIISRAFMPWKELLHVCTGLTEEGGTVVVLANQPPSGEGVQGWTPGLARPYDLPSGRRYFWSFIKAPS
ncbi:MAG: 16S rRNA (guanine(527)-N(7))-methyltransferase RsmG, partial [Desulfovibrionales bacterium]